MNEKTIANTAQAEAWNGPEGQSWAAHHDRARGVNSALHEHLFAAAAIQPSDRVLDIGCGAGETTRLAARHAGAGTAVGVDLSDPMLQAARRAAAEEGIANIRFEQADAQVHPFPDAYYDVAISQFGIMFFADPVAAFANIGRALRPGGRLVFVCPRHAALCDWYTVPLSALGHLPAPDSGMFSLADRARLMEILDGAGLRAVTLETIETYLTFGSNLAEATDFFAGSGPVRAFMQRHPGRTPEEVRSTLATALRPYESYGGVRLRGSHWLVSAKR